MMSVAVTRYLSVTTSRHSRFDFFDLNDCILFSLKLRVWDTEYLQSYSGPSQPKKNCYVQFVYKNAKCDGSKCSHLITS